MGKAELLVYLRGELNQYNRIINSQTKREKKQYIDGLMKASRFFGVSYEELKEITDSELKEHINSLTMSGDDDLLDVPTFIRKYGKVSV